MAALHSSITHSPVAIYSTFQHACVHIACRHYVLSLLLHRTSANRISIDITILLSLFTGIPDPPYDMKFVNATHNSITLQWTAGFDGGSPQWFQVRYSETGEEGQKYEDVMPPNSAVYTIKGMCHLLKGAQVQHM